MYVLYTVLLLLSGLGLLPRVLWRCLRGATYHRDLAERCGYGIVPPTAVQAGGARRGERNRQGQPSRAI